MWLIPQEVHFLLKGMNMSGGKDEFQAVKYELDF